jgi:hypothetical protein
MRSSSNGSKGGGRSLHRWPDGRGGQMTPRLGRHLALAAMIVLVGCSQGPGATVPTMSPPGTPSPTGEPTENGQPVELSYTSPDGEVTVSAPSTWYDLWPEEAAHEVAPDVWFGLLWQGPGPRDSNEYIGLVDPVAYDSWCAANGGSPVLSAPAGAAAIAQQVIADPNFETTAPVAARVGGVEAVSIDVALAPGGSNCGVQMIAISRWIHSLEPGLRLRLYLVDLPEGMSVETLAITVVAPEERFEEFIEQTTPIIDSIEFHAP